MSGLGNGRAGNWGRAGRVKDDLSYTVADAVQHQRPCPLPMASRGVGATYVVCICGVSGLQSRIPFRRSK